MNSMPSNTESSKITVPRDLPVDKVWRRYMDLPKLLDLLHSNSLFVPRADGFSDRLEGALFPSFRAQMDKLHASGESEFSAEDIRLRSRVCNYVSCWTLGANDSMAHWQLFAGVNTGVVVTTTLGRILAVARTWNREVIISCVKYVDHANVRDYVIGRYDDILQYKHEAYRHENEVRIIVPQHGIDWASNDDHLRLSVPTLDDLVRSVVVAPEASVNYLDAVRELCSRFGLSAPVRRSKLTYVAI